MIDSLQKTDDKNLNKVGCFILRMPENRYDLFLSNTTWAGYFTEPVNEFKHSGNLPIVCFIVSPEGLVTHLSKGRKGRSGGTALRLLTLIDVEKLKTPLSLEEVLNAIPLKVKRYAEDRVQNGGVFPPKTSEKFIDAVLELYPETESMLARFGKLYRLRLGRLTENERFALAGQKEAVATAMAIANIDREPLQEWVLTTDEKPMSFLDGLEKCRVLEDQILATDFSYVPGYKHVKNVNHGIALFDDGYGKSLTVVLANRHALEKTTGTDLIYYNEKFHAFVMVQYKAMEDERGDAVYRLPNKQLSEEISRMNEVLKELEKCSPNNHHNGFRLNENPFYLKFCPRLNFSPNDKSLSKGMYIDLGYWLLLQDASELCGPLGGKKLTYFNVGRYLDNTEFINLVSNAWIGTTVSQSSFLKPYIREALEHNRAVVIAVKNDVYESEKSSL